MSEPTDPRVEAAAQALCDAAGYNPSGDSITPVNNPEMDVNWKVYAPDAEIALKAADEAAWRPIEGVKDCPLAALIEQGSDEGPYIGSCRDSVWCDGFDMVEPTHYMPLPPPPETTP